METEALCRKPDGRGQFNPRCQHFIDTPKGETERRQCRAAARHGTLFCDAHSADQPLVRQSRILGTNVVTYSAWETYSFDGHGSHSTLTTLDPSVSDSGWIGRIGTRRLTPELDALPPRTDERINAVQAFHAEQYEFAYAAIIAAFPDAANGRRSMGEITVTEAVS